MPAQRASQAESEAGRFFFSTPVWGAGHLGLFLSIGLPSLLARGNLAGLSNPKQCRYFFYTRPDDEPLLKASPAFQRLSDLMPVEVILLTDPIDVPHRTMSDCHMHTMRRADEAGVAAVFVPPDCVWSDCSFKRLEGLLAEGKSVVHISGVRTHRDELVPHLRDYLSSDGTGLEISPRQLVKLGLENLHPIAYTHFWKEHPGGLMPANLYWTVPGEGLALRCFHLHPLMVKSQVQFAKFASTIDDDLALTACPDVSRDHVVTDSDEILCFEMSGLDRVVGTVCVKNSVEAAAEWTEYGTNKRHRDLGLHAIRLHSKPIDPSLWQPIESEAAEVVGGIVRLNNLPTHLLATDHPLVFKGRMYAVALGRGSFAERDLKFARRVLQAKDFLLGAQRSLKSRLFLRNGATRITHPMWLVRRATHAAIKDSILPSEKGIVLFGVDPGFAHALESAVPGLRIRTVDIDRLPDPSIIAAALGGIDDLAVTVDFQGNASAGHPPHLTNPTLMARRHVWLRLGAPQTNQVAFAQDGVETIWFGGAGTRLSRSIWLNTRQLVHRYRGSLTVTHVAVKTLGLVVLPVAYVAAAVGGLGLNLVSSGLNYLDAGPRRGQHIPFRGLVRKRAG